MVDIKVGMYFRAYGKIDKVRNIVRRSSLYEDSGIYGERYGKFIMGSKVIDEVPHSHNIIDLIEEGDYVNGDIVIVKYELDELSEGVLPHIVTRTGKHIFEDDIESVVTHEQFESMKYEVE